MIKFHYFMEKKICADAGSFGATSKKLGDFFDFLLLFIWVTVEFKLYIFYGNRFSVFLTRKTYKYKNVAHNLPLIF